MESQIQPATRTILKKLTAKTICGKVDLEDLLNYTREKGGDTMPLFSMVGRASDFSTGESDFGPYIKLLGMFKATNVKNGEVSRSGAAILPGSANDLIYGALRGLGDAGGTVDFAVRVSIKRDKESATGYVYVVEQVLLEGENDALAAIENKIGNVKQISDASKAPPALEHEPESESKTGTGSKKK